MTAKKTLAIICCVAGVIVVPVIVNAAVCCLIPVERGRQGDWIGFGGDYLGAVLGGIIAFFVAKIQVDAAREQERLSRTHQQLPTICELLLEVSKAEVYLKGKKQLADTVEELRAQLRRDTGQEIDPLLGACLKATVNESAWYHLDRLVDPELTLAVIEFREAYLGLVDRLSVDLGKLDAEISARRARLEEIDESGSSEAVLLEKQRLIIEHRDLNLEHMIVVEEKKRMWVQIAEGWYDDKVESLRMKLEAAKDEASASARDR